MDQSDLDLLQTVPSYHWQSVVKTRRLSPTPSVFNSGSASGTSTPAALAPAQLAELAQKLFDEQSLMKVLHELGEVESRILRELVSYGGRANSRDLALYLSNADLLNPEAPTNIDFFEQPRLTTLTMPLHPPQYPSAHPHGPFEQALRHLLILGLVYWGRQTNFAGRDYTSGIYDGVLIVPHAVRDAVYHVWSPAVPVWDDTALFQHAEGSEAGRELQRTLYRYWSLVAALRDGLSLVNNGLLSRSSLRQVSESFASTIQHVQQEHIRAENELPYLYFLRLLLTQLGLLHVRDGAVYAQPAEAFFSLPLLERARHCYFLYRNEPFWNELGYLAEVNVRPGPTPLEPAHEEVVHARQAVLDRLRFEPLERWKDISTFIARTKLHLPYLLFPRQYGLRAERYSSNSNPYGWDFRLRRGWLTHREGWHMVEGGFIRAILTGPLHWLGITELDAVETPSTFRLSPATPLLVSNTPVPVTEEMQGRLIVQPNFELVALAPVSEALLIKLDRFAERVSLEHIAQYRITRASVTRAIQRGLSLEDIRAPLIDAAEGGIPQNVDYSLSEWERQARRIELWPAATLLEVDEPALLDTLLADAQARSLLGRRLSPCQVEVLPGKLAALHVLLWQRDYLPASTTSTSEETASSTYQPQWRLDEAGVLHPLYPVLDLYRVAEVQRYAEPVEQKSSYRLTATSVQRALEGGIALDTIVRFLQQYCRDGIPGSFLIRLKLWGHGYGTREHIHVEHAPFLHLAPEVLHDLRADPEVSALLGSELTQASSLVQIAPQNLERILAILHERGFPVS